MVSPRRTVILVPAGIVMVSLTGVDSAGLGAADPLFADPLFADPVAPGAAAPLPALPFAAFGSGVADAEGVPEFLEHPTARHSASSAATYTLRKSFTSNPLWIHCEYLEIIAAGGENYFSPL